MTTEKIRLWRYNDAGEVGPWRTGPFPSITPVPVEIAWALLAEEPMEASGRPPGTPDQLIGFVESRDAALTVVRQEYGARLWVASASWWNNTEKRLNAGSALGTGDTAIEAVIDLMCELGVPQ